MRKLVFRIFGSVCILVFPLALGVAVASNLDGGQLVKIRCNKCHSLQRIEAAQKDSEQWKSTVDRMLGKGAELNEQEKEAVLDYLSQKEHD
ncbi:MAG: hypothetical protein ACOCP7_01315 [Desulfohalobiaceae bacterium]